MITSSLSSSSSSSLHRLNRRTPSPAAPPLSLLSVFSSTSSNPASASTAAAGPPFRNRAPRISLVGISRQPLSLPLLSSLSLCSLSATFHRTRRFHCVAGREVAIVDEIDGEDEFYGEEEEEEEGDELEGEDVVDVDDVGGDGEVVGDGDGGSMRLSVKEKKELASYANSLGKKLKSQLVGKSGVTESVGRSFVETLEANELLKIKIHRTCPGELDDVIKRLEMLTGSVVVGQIGRTVIIYRPSISKMKAEEEKEKARRIFRRRKPSSRFAPLKSRATTRPPGRGHRGSSRPRV